ncbi:nicotinamide-nucleotide adenylyltransferase [Candidatus Micrarchaeota archaeon]|nr:nicotinamide-nucleotide adenylyltransferase [Candidatus Micrarchaeota archaeon]
MPKVHRGVYWGRFNPPHNGHIKVIEHLLANGCDELVIAIGSALSSHTPRNPFTGGERLLMLKAMLGEAGLLDKAVIVQVPDAVGSYEQTANNLMLVCPPFDAIFTNRGIIADVFSRWGIATKSFPFFERDDYNSTRIRSEMLDGGKWEKLVPPSVANWLISNGGIERIKLVEKDRYEEQ